MLCHEVYAENTTHSVRFACGMERSTLELSKVTEEYCHERGDILRRFYGCRLKLHEHLTKWSSRDIHETYHRFPMVRVGEANPDRLINEDDACLVDPRVRIPHSTIRIKYCAGT